MDKKTEKVLGNTNIAEAKAATPDLVVFGDGDMWKLLGKVSSESAGWMGSTKAMEVPGGCIIMITNRLKNPDGSWAISDAVTPVIPNARIIPDKDPNDHNIIIGRHLSGRE